MKFQLVGRVVFLGFCSSVSYAVVSVEVINNTKYSLYGSIRWGNGCSKDTFALSPSGSGKVGHWLVGRADYAAVAISWNNFLGLGKTCPLQSISFKATTPNVYNNYVNDELSFEYTPKQKVSVGPKGTCKNMRIFINESHGEEKFIIEHECFD